MINKVDSVGNVKVNSNPNFKSEEKTVSKFVENKEFNTKALANYSMASIDFKNKLKVTPLIPTIYLPEAVDAIKGERIYKSNGDLYAIIEQNEKTRTIYTPVEGSDNMFQTIITTDKKTGNVIREQFNEIEGREHKNIYIHQFSPETGKEVAFTRYNEGELECASKIIYNKDGSETRISYDYDNKEYDIFEISKDGRREKSIRMTDDMKFITVNSSYRNNARKVYTRAEYYNGALLNSETTNASTTSNMMGLDYLNDKDMMPEKIITKEEIQELINSIDGEKTFFSNGTVESLKGKYQGSDVKICFNPVGEATEIITEKEQIILDYYFTSHTKFIDKNYKITSTKYKNDGSSVTLEKDGKFIEANYSQKGIISSYYEGEIKEDGRRDYTLSLLYDDKGMLINAYNN